MQGRNITNVMIINPTEMTDDEEIILNYFLENKALNGIYFHDKGCAIPIPLDQIECETDIDLGYFNQIQLTHPILRRSRNSDINQSRYEVYGDMIGGGAFGKVSMSIGTLVPLENHRMLLKKGNVRVIKEMISNNETALKKIANQEYEMTRRDEELGVKRPVIFLNRTQSHEAHSFMVMKFVAGVRSEEQHV